MHMTTWNTFLDSREKFWQHTTSRNPTRPYIANPSFIPLTMATLEMAGRPLQSLWSPTPTCMHADSCQNPHLSLFMATLPKQHLRGTQKSPGTHCHECTWLWLQHELHWQNCQFDHGLHYLPCQPWHSAQRTDSNEYDYTPHNCTSPLQKHRKRHYILHTFHSMKCIHPCNMMQHTFQACSFRQQHLLHPCIGCFPLLPTIPEGSVWHWHYTWATQKAPLQTYQYRPTTDAINPVLQQVTTMTNNPQPLHCIISATFAPNQSPTVVPTHASPTFCHHTRLPTIAELAGTSMDAQLPIQYCIVRVRCNNSLTLP